MTSKYELSISTGYVRDWGIVEAFRELFQNALDNETTHPENKMEWGYDEESETIRICNKTSVLQAETLLLGCTTKADDKYTIGKHGEGYKIAFMVLLRNSKKIKVYNYGNREIWDVRLVKSKRYNGQFVTTIFVEKGAFWSKVPNNDLTIEVSGITKEEYNEITSKNLNLRRDTIEKVTIDNRGSIILNEDEMGNIYVKGLYVTHMEKLQYGYDFEPEVLNLDRDRKLVDSFNVSWEASVLWSMASDKDENIRKKGVQLIKNNALDVFYVSKVTTVSSLLNNEIASDFFAEYGDDAVPVTSNTEYNLVKASNEGNPIFVDDKIADIVKKSTLVIHKETSVRTSVKSKLLNMLGMIEGKLTEDEFEQFEYLINLVEN